MNTNNKNTKKVIVGDGAYQREEEIEYREVEYLEPEKEKRWHLGNIEFDGHITLWGFEYFPTTYLKSSGLSGDEYRKGGEVRIFRDRKQVYSEFVRETDYAVKRVIELLDKLQQLRWEDIVEGTKLYYERTPCFVERIIWEQGCFILKAEDGYTFEDPVWAKEDWQKLEENTSLKVEFISPKIWWYRN